MTMIQKEEKITILFIGANYNRQKVIRTEKEFKFIFLKIVKSLHFCGSYL